MNEYQYQQENEPRGAIQGQNHFELEEGEIQSEAQTPQHFGSNYGALETGMGGLNVNSAQTQVSKAKIDDI